MTKPKSEEQRKYKQLFFNFNKGTNRTKPRKRAPNHMWRLWCGWCEKDHQYPASVTAEVAKAMHEDQMLHICRVRAHGDDPFG